MNYNNDLQNNNQILQNILDTIVNLPEVNTFDATASANTILNGYTAYVNGEKITGAYEPPEQQTEILASSNIIIPIGYEELQIVYYDIYEKTYKIINAANSNIINTSLGQSVIIMKRSHLSNISFISVQGNGVSLITSTNDTIIYEVSSTETMIIIQTFSN